MRIRIDDIRCDAFCEKEQFYPLVRKAYQKLQEELKIPDGAPGKIEESQIRILKKSLDARKKPSLFYIYSVEILFNEPVDSEQVAYPHSLFRIAYNTEEQLKPDAKPGSNPVSKSTEKISGITEKFLSERPVVAGSGPAGLFAALHLAVKGYRPVLIERGKPVKERISDIQKFWKTGILDPESNVQFGEGGAGTFSDGKLTTGIKDPACRMVLETFADAGAPDEILYLAKPHIGTDHLRGVVKKIREKIEEAGGTVLFETRLSGISEKDGNLQAISLESSRYPDIRQIATDSLILATGHSARDTIRMLHEKKVAMQQKPFSMGVRIEHLQTRINESQYGVQNKENEKNLPAADYKLSCHLPSGRDVYTFCMCPGGQVIAGSSGEGQVVTNGMSYHSRAGENANSAVLVNVTPADFGGDSPIAGLDFQEKWEHLAFLAGGSGYKAPAQYVGSFLGYSSAKKEHFDKQKVIPSYTPGVMFTRLETCLPDFVTQSLKEALPVFDRKISGFAAPGAVMTGIESRSSCPVRILRDERGMSNIRGIYPCGEGAGYAGGIMSAAVDGIHCAGSLIMNRSETGR